MKIVGVRALRENPGVISESAKNGELLLVTNRSSPVSIAVPFGEALLQSGVHVNVAIKLFEDGALSLVKSAALARMSTESFMELLAALEVPAVKYDVSELDSEMDILGE